MNARKTITVLVAARDEAAHIERTLRSIAGQSRPPDRTIVVDDGSRDRTGRIASRCGADVIRLDAPSGKKSKAQNAALSSIGTDLVVTVDADTILEERALERLVAPFEGDDPPTGTYGYVVSREPRSVFQRGRDIEIRVQQFFQKVAQDLWNVPLVAPGCVSCWLTAAIRKLDRGFESHERSLAEDMEITMHILTNREHFGNEGRGRIAFVRDAFAYTIDPKSFLLYWRQVNRWYSAFFQNLKIHYGALLRLKRPALSIFVLCYLFDGLAGFAVYFLLPLLSLAKLWAWDWKVALWSIFGLLIVRTVFTGAISLHEGFRIARLTTPKTQPLKRAVRILFSPKETLWSLPCYLFITDPINRILWPAAFVREILLGRWCALSDWKKGH